MGTLGAEIKQRKVTHGGGANSAPSLVSVPKKNCKTQQGNTADSILVILLVWRTEMRHFSPPNSISCMTSCVCERVQTDSVGRCDLLTSLFSAVDHSARDYADSKSGAINYGVLEKKKKLFFCCCCFSETPLNTKLK